MALKHSNPTQKRYDSKNVVSSEAFAPYNFIPLPEKVVPAPVVVDDDVYHKDTISCWIDVELETLSPTYVRGMMTTTQFKNVSGKNNDELSQQEKEELAEPFQINKLPVIPGSSLRGMLRSIIEIASYGNIKWVAKTPIFTYRAVAAQRDDPLEASYKAIVGKFANNVRAGYLNKKSNGWFIRPAKLPQTLPGCRDSTEKFLKIKEERIGSRDIPEFVRLSSESYKPRWFKVCFEARQGRTKFGKSIFVDQINGQHFNLPNRGVLVCSGNMAESGKKKGSLSKRTTHTIILEAANPLEDGIKIQDQAVEDYLAGMTTFQREELEAWSKDRQGCLGHNAPVFYVEPQGGGEIIYFGHSPNFRIPMRFSKSDRASTPMDFVPFEARNEAIVDFSTAMFGQVDEITLNDKVSTIQRGGHLFFSDAKCTSDTSDIWWKPNSIVALHTLSSPKATSFQHYLVQDKQAGHDPDVKSHLAHYGVSPSETQIRGFKRYWHKGPSPDIEANIKELGLKKQLTHVKPLKAGVKFEFRIHFENLHREELGALLWALILPGQSGKSYAHSIGMGKPLGMGAVRLKVLELKITNRPNRYKKLFFQNGWQEAANAESAEDYIKSFEQYVMRDLGKNGAFAENERIQMLLAMQEWVGPENNLTRYMEIERTLNEITYNEYKERPVLPDPLAVIRVKPTQKFDPRPEPVNSNPGHETGRVLKFGLGPLKDFGFIKPDSGGPDLFVHRNKLARGVSTLSSGQKVLYQRVVSAKGYQAVDVQVIA